MPEARTPALAAGRRLRSDHVTQTYMIQVYMTQNCMTRAKINPAAFALSSAGQLAVGQSRCRRAIFAIVRLGGNSCLVVDDRGDPNLPKRASSSVSEPGQQTRLAIAAKSGMFDQPFRIHPILSCGQAFPRTQLNVHNLF